jgi:membrane-associated phospholipid phosphatase
VAVLTAIAAVVARLVTRRWRASAFIVLAVAGEKLVYLVSSILVSRERPDVPTVGDTYATHSFPSGHVGAAVALYGSILLLTLWWRRAPTTRTVWPIAVLALPVGIVAWCRVYRGFHFPTDVLAGTLLGAVWLIGCWVVVMVPALRRAPQPAGFEERATGERPCPTKESTPCLQPPRSTAPTAPARTTRSAAWRQSIRGS